MQNSPVQQIKDRLGIEEVVSSYLKVERAGANLKARCPFHNEKTPSFFISPDRGSYYCFGCGAKGDIFTFVEEFEGLDFKGALKLLADRAGVVLEKFNKEAESEKEKLYRIMEEATKFFETNLQQNGEVLEYLKSRGLTEQSIKEFRIGYIKDAWRELYDHLVKRGFKDPEIEKAGLIKKVEKTMPDGKQGYYDRFRGRIMFPIADSSARIIAFSGRLFEVGLSAEALAKASAKYLNSPETSIFYKSAVLYGLDKAKESIRKNNFSILVEGQFDLVLSHQAGFKNTVATSGTALSDSEFSKASSQDELQPRENVVSNLGLLRRLSGNIVLAYDGDQAGIKAAERASKIALSLGMDVKVAPLPEGQDPADIVSREGKDAWREIIRKSKHVIEFLLEKVLEKNLKDSRYVGKEIKEKILPYVSIVDSAIEKAHFIKRISERAGIPEEALKEDLKKVEQEKKHERIEIKETEELQSKIFRKDYIERRLLGIYFWQKNVSDKKLNDDFILNELAEILQIDKTEIENKNADKKEDLIFEAEVFYGAGIDIEKDARELLFNLKEESLKEKLFINMGKLRKAEEEKDNGKSKQILIEINEINKKIQEIKNSRTK